MNKPNQDAGIPLLTEIIPSRLRAEPVDDIPELPISAALPPSPPLDSTPPASVHAPSDNRVLAVPIEGWLDGEWTRLEQKISERTLNTLMERLDPVLETHIRESISASLDEAMDTIRANLQLSIEQLVRESVAEEIRNLNFSKNKEF